MRRLLTGSFVTLLLLLNTLALFGPLMVFALFKLILPGRLRDYASWAVMWIAETWAEIDKLIFARCIPTQWDIRGGEGLRQDTSYLVISNHQSWVDIPALIQTLNRRTPFFKFFLKKELIWVPFLGLAWWALDYPFMKRYSKAFLARHPELHGKDLEITKVAWDPFHPDQTGAATFTVRPFAQPQGRRRGLRAGGHGRTTGCGFGCYCGLPAGKDPGVLEFDQR